MFFLHALVYSCNSA